MNLLFEALLCRQPDKMCMYPINCTRRQECLSKHQEKPMEQKQRNGSPEFYKLLERMADIHDKKSHDYAMASNPFSNFERAGEIASWFKHPVDIAFGALIGVKLARMAELTAGGKIPNNESLDDTQLDLATYAGLWAAWRKSQIKVCSKCGHQQLFHDFQQSGKCAFCECSLVFIS
jgi:hypothetical protein